MSKSAENKSQIKKIKKIIKAKFRTDFVFYGLFFRFGIGAFSGRTGKLAND